MIRLAWLVLCQNDIKEEFQKFMNFNVGMSTFCDRFQKRLCGWWVDFPCSHAFAETTFSAVKLCLSLSDYLSVECDFPADINVFYPNQRLFY